MPEYISLSIPRYDYVANSWNDTEGRVYTWAMVGVAAFFCFVFSMHPVSGTIQPVVCFLVPPMAFERHCSGGTLFALLCLDPVSGANSDPHAARFVWSIDGLGAAAGLARPRTLGPF